MRMWAARRWLEWPTGYDADLQSRYYVDLIEGAGYTKAMDLLAYLSDLTHNTSTAPASTQDPRVAEKVRERYNLKVRLIEMKHFDEEAERIKLIYNSAGPRTGEPYR
jgi:hypothetical protein